VAIPLGRATARTSTGRTVRRGELIALGQPNAHASIDGMVLSVLSDRIVLRS
jgi:hypothetical protein